MAEVYQKIGVGTLLNNFQQKTITEVNNIIDERKKVYNKMIATTAVNELTLIANALSDVADAAVSTEPVAAVGGVGGVGGVGEIKGSEVSTLLADEAQNVLNEIIAQLNNYFEFKIKTQDETLENIYSLVLFTCKKYNISNNNNDV